jgi:hypothetical protein
MDIPQPTFHLSNPTCESAFPTSTAMPGQICAAPDVCPDLCTGGAPQRQPGDPVVVWQIDLRERHAAEI